MIRKYYVGSALTLFVIPAVVGLGALGFDALDPERAAGHANYAQNFARLQYLRMGLQLVAMLAAGALWLLSCLWLLRAKSRNRIWVSLALFGPLGYVGLSMLKDRSPLAPHDAYGRFMARLNLPVQVFYEIVRLVALWYAAMQLVEWQDTATALFEASRRGLSLQQILAERDASSGMWAFGDLLRAALVIVVLYVLWPPACNLIAAFVRLLRPRPPGED